MQAIKSISDNELALLLKDGSELAYTEIYNRYWDRLYFIGHKLLKDPDVAEEIVQDVFLTLWNKKETLSIQSLTQYLGAMTRYAVYRHLSKEKQQREQENRQHLYAATTSDGADVDNKILLEFIADLSNKLPEKCRLVFQYNKLQDISIAEISERMNISQKTAEGHLTKALRLIRANFGSSISDFLAILAILSVFKR